MNNPFMGDKFTGRRGGGGADGWPAAALWDAMEQFRGQFDRKSGMRMGRGDVRAAVLALLAEGPMHGYQIIHEIEERSGGAWKPSPGSVYPTIQQLEDEGLVEGISTNGRRENVLTEAGRTYVEEHPDELAATWRPFDEAADEDDSPPGLKPAIGQVMSAVWQVASTGSPQQQAQAAEILADTRRRLYGLLADGDPE